MKIIKGLIATTHVDRQYERFTVEALHDGVRQIQQGYLPVWLEHDVKSPPIGRTISANVVPLENGEFGLEAISQIWEDGDTPSALKGDGRRVILATQNADSVTIGYDRTFCIEVDTILDSATPEMLDAFFAAGIIEVDSICEAVHQSQPDVARVVTEQQKDSVDFIFHVTDDGLPSVRTTSDVEKQALSVGVNATTEQ